MQTENDRNLADSVILDFANASHLSGDYSGRVVFQFPPIVTSDGRSAEWVERNLRGDQPVFVFKLSKAREIKLEWTYIVGMGANGGTLNGAWTTKDVKNQVSGLRNYFSKPAGHGEVAEKAGKFGAKGATLGDSLVVTYWHWQFGGSEPMSALLKSINISHGKTIVVPEGTPDDAFALRTDISVELRLWEKGGRGDAKGEGLVGAGDDDDKGVKTDLTQLDPHIPLDWQ
jgi:hypothetical protein